jgi:hypothetical protein
MQNKNMHRTVSIIHFAIYKILYDACYLLHAQFARNRPKSHRNDYLMFTELAACVFVQYLAAFPIFGMAFFNMNIHCFHYFYRIKLLKRNFITLSIPKEEQNDKGAL